MAEAARDVGLFVRRAHRGGNPAMKIDTPRFEEKSRAAAAGLPEFDALRARARAVKDRTLEHLDHCLETWESAAAAGGRVHWRAQAACAGRPGGLS